MCAKFPLTNKANHNDFMFFTLNERSSSFWKNVQRCNLD